MGGQFSLGPGAALCWEGADVAGTVSPRASDHSEESSRSVSGHQDLVPAWAVPGLGESKIWRALFY